MILQGGWSLQKPVEGRAGHALQEYCCKAATQVF